MSDLQYGAPAVRSVGAKAPPPRPDTDMDKQPGDGDLRYDHSGRRPPTQ